MAKVLMKWLGINPTEKQLEALIKKFHTVQDLEDYLSQIMMTDKTEKRYNWFMTWLSERK